MFTFDQVFTKISEIASRNENNVADCVYAEENMFGTFVPVCIVGHWLYAEGLLDIEDWPKIEDHNADYVCDLLEKQYGMEIDGQARKFLTLVQGIQDRQTPWGEALDAAIAAMGRDSND